MTKVENGLSTLSHDISSDDLKYTLRMLGFEFFENQNGNHVWSYSGSVPCQFYSERIAAELKTLSKDGFKDPISKYGNETRNEVFSYLSRIMDGEKGLEGPYSDLKYPNLSRLMMFMLETELENLTLSEVATVLGREPNYDRICWDHGITISQFPDDPNPQIVYERANGSQKIVINEETRPPLSPPVLAQLVELKKPTEVREIPVKEKRKYKRWDKPVAVQEDKRDEIKDVNLSFAIFETREGDYAYPDTEKLVKENVDETISKILDEFTPHWDKKGLGIERINHGMGELFRSLKIHPLYRNLSLSELQKVMEREIDFIDLCKMADLSRLSDIPHFNDKFISHAGYNG